MAAAALRNQGHALLLFDEPMPGRIGTAFLAKRCLELRHLRLSDTLRPAAQPVARPPGAFGTVPGCTTRSPGPRALAVAPAAAGQTHKTEAEQHQRGRLGD